MEHLGETYISVSYTRDNYVNLNLRMRSENTIWNSAIDMFIDRIEGRYINVIKRMLSDNTIMIDGFPVMALDCLLIETLLQFRNGWDETQGPNKTQYSNFLLSAFPSEFHNVRTLADKFYKNIRCGILHSAQTKNGSQLTFGKPFAINEINERQISVDVVKMTYRIFDYFYLYIDELFNENNDYLRYNFMCKMNYICRNYPCSLD